MQPSKAMLPYFASTQLKEHSSDYLIIKMDIKHEKIVNDNFSNFTFLKSYTVDHDEISLIIKKHEWDQKKKNFPEHIQEGPYRIITFDIILELSLVGYLSVISSVLATEGISIFALSTYQRDHILIKKHDSKRAIKVLESLITESKLMNQN